MPSDTEQNFSNHARLVPGFHFVTGLPLVVYVIWAAWRAVSLKDVESHFDLLGAVALAGTFWYARIFPLKAQDRVIRLEEHLRLARVLPADLRDRIGELSPRQLIALRFAADDEVGDLVRWVLTDRVTDSKQIKQRIQRWRPDHFRV